MGQRIYAFCTTNTYLAAVSYAMNLLGKPDPTNWFLVQKELKGYREGDRRVDSRQPISFSLLVLKGMVARLDDVTNNNKHWQTFWRSGKHSVTSIVGLLVPLTSGFFL